MASVVSNQLGYTKAEVARAKEAQCLMKRLGFCSCNEAKRMLNCGNLLETPVTSADIERATNIFGPMISREKGFMVDIGPVGLLRPEYAPLMRDNLIAYMDVGHFFGETYLVSVFKPINLIVTKYVGK